MDIKELSRTEEKWDSTVESVLWIFSSINTNKSLTYTHLNKTENYQS